MARADTAPAAITVRPATAVRIARPAIAVEATAAAHIPLEAVMRAVATPVVAADTAVEAIGKHSLLFWL